MHEPAPNLAPATPDRYVMTEPGKDAWRDQKRKPRGMQRFSKWHRRRVDSAKIAPSDIDGVKHSRIGDRLLFLEFKPIGRAWVLPNAQAETYRSISARRGQQVLAVFAPGWDDESDDVFPDDTVVGYQIFRGGRAGRVKRTTMKQLSIAVADWHHNEGPLAETA